MQKKIGTILVVDDENAIVELVEDVLTAQGYDVITATDGMEAIELTKYSDSNIDLLMTDVFMPGMKGHELAKKFKKVQPDSKVLYMSGFMCPPITEDERKNREKDFIQKPFSPAKLKKALKKLLT